MKRSQAANTREAQERYRQYMRALAQVNRLEPSEQGCYNAHRGTEMDLFDHLRRVPLFQKLSVDALRLLASICEERNVRAGTLLVRQADLGANFYLIDSGEAIVHHINEQGLRRPVRTLRAGEYFGVTSLFLGEPRDASVTALTEMHLWVINRTAFSELLETHPAIRRNLIIPEDILSKLRAPRYPWLNAGEMVLHHSRRHVFILLRRVAAMTLAMLALSGLIIARVVFGSGSIRGLLLLLPVCIIYTPLALWRWFDWRNDYFVVTTHRVTHREQVAFVYESRDEMPIDRVQDTNVERQLLGSLFDFGTLTIETAAKAKLVLQHIPRPEYVRELISQQLARARATRHAAERQVIRNDLVSSLNIQTITPAEAVAGQEQPVSALAVPEAPEMRPGFLVRTMNTLGELGLLPRTRIETPESVTWRKHWIFLLRQSAPPFLFGIGFGVVTILGLYGWPEQILSRLPFYPLLSFVATLVCMALFWWNASDWSNDEYIVTNERIIDIEKRPFFFSEQRREANLGAIQNISLRIPNLAAGVFNYGDVIVQTAGTEDFTFEKVPNPNEVQREIFRRMDVYREGARQREAALRRAELSQWFSIYQELNEGRADGVSCLRPNDTWHFYSPSDGLSSGDVRAIAVTPDGSVWFGTNDGVSRMTPRGNWENLNTQDGLVSNDIRAVALGRDGSVWFGTPQGASHLTRHRTWQTFTASDGLASNLVTSLAVGPDGSVWFGSDRGASRLMPNGEWQQVDHRVGLAHDHVLSIVAAGDGSVWFGTWNGVSLLTTSGEWKTLTREAGLAANMALSIAVAPDGAMWFGTDFGVSRFYPAENRWESFSTRDGLAGSTVWTIAIAPSGTVWLGTEAGASRRTPDGLWRTFTRRDGLATDAIKVIAISPDGTVWLG